MNEFDPKKRIYLDANGASPPLDEARDVLLHAIGNLGNPSSSHEHGRRLRTMIDQARAHVACAINAREKDVIFTSGATESNRLFVDALVLKAKAKKRRLLVQMSPFEHPSLQKPMRRAADDGYLSIGVMGISPAGKISSDFSGCDVLIACMAHNETGIVIDIEEMIGCVGDGCLIMSDISQGFSRLAQPSDRIDVLTFSAQKMGGFAGSGGIVIRNRALSLPPPWQGGGQERGFRPGTESAFLIAAFGEAARHIDRSRSINSQLSNLRDLLEEGLVGNGAKVIGKDVKRLPNTSAICFPHEDPNALRIACDMAGLSVGFGSACSGLAPEGSFALGMMGLSDKEQRSTVRFSLPPFITEEEIHETVGRMQKRVLGNTMQSGHSA